MADGTHIEWTDATWNPITGCSVVSPGCTHCYAMKLAGTRLQHHPSRAGLTRDSKAGPVWTGEVRLNEGWLDQPLRWRRPRRIFVCAHGDLFHPDVPEDWINQIFAVMALAQHHTFQVLTKRPERMRAWFRGDEDRGDAFTRIISAAPRMMEDGDAWWSYLQNQPWPLPNVWLGVSVEDQQRADERIPILLDTPAALRWISAEPLLGPLDLRPWLSEDDGCEYCDDGDPGAPHCTRRDIARENQCPRKFAVFDITEHLPFDADGTPAAVTCDRITLDWVVAGGESGPGARPMHPDWARGLRDQCAAADVPFYFKQWGDWLPHLQALPDGCINVKGAADDWHYFDGPARESAIRIGKKAAGRLLDGRAWDGFPA